jgi:hypothetical protein
VEQTSGNAPFDILEKTRIAAQTASVDAMVTISGAPLSLMISE